jgi:hypothetical protein
MVMGMPLGMAGMGGKAARTLAARGWWIKPGQAAVDPAANLKLGAWINAR